MRDSLFLSAAFITVEIGFIAATSIGKFDFFLILVHLRFGQLKLLPFLLAQLRMNCGLEILFGQMKKSSVQQYRANGEGELVTSRSTILREENITIGPFLHLRKIIEVDRHVVLPPQMIDMKLRVQEEEVPGIAQDVW
jgi:hypothetical protein